MFKTPTHQSWVEQPIPYTIMSHLGYRAGTFIPDSSVTPEAERLMKDGEAQAFLEQAWEFDNPKPDFPCPVS
jgi:hypothetical protein